MNLSGTSLDVYYMAVNVGDILESLWIGLSVCSKTFHVTTQTFLIRCLPIPDSWQNEYNQVLATYSGFPFAPFDGGFS